ncbi:MAG: hypothetical protein M8364_19140 [Methylobacter sp.]|uniref:hypothetical protein n=1 Tax=Methylobacter TaxID=429 RepID=UPI0003794C4E|nr:MULTISPECIES: hypothetical protein [Methylobacter]MCL7423011.1 hypothetical protein [Methylobacter sp.]
MNKGNVVPAESVVVVDFQNYKIRSIAQEYVRLLAEYGVEAASLWSMDKVTDNIEKKQFNQFVIQEMRKYGFVAREH